MLKHEKVVKDARRKYKIIQKKYKSDLQNNYTDEFRKKGYDKLFFFLGIFVGFLLNITASIIDTFAKNKLNYSVYGIVVLTISFVIIVFISYVIYKSNNIGVFINILKLDSSMRNLEATLLEAESMNKLIRKTQKDKSPFLAIRLIYKFLKFKYLSNWYGRL